MTQSPLTQKSCVPCRGDTPPLTPEEVARLSPQAPGWAVEEGQRLRRTFRFKDYASALAFVDRVGALAEAEGHHPDISFGWGRAEVTFTTHIIKGLSENDFIMAAKTDVLAGDAPGIRKG